MQKDTGKYGTDVCRDPCHHINLENTQGSQTRDRTHVYTEGKNPSHNIISFWYLQGLMIKDEMPAHEAGDLKCMSAYKVTM